MPVATPGIPPVQTASAVAPLQPPPPVAPVPPATRAVPAPSTAPTVKPKAVPSLPKLSSIRFRVPIGVYIAAGLVVLGGILVGLSEFGAVALGVEQFWGLSNRANQALAVGAQTLLGSTNYRVTGRITLDGVVPVADAAAAPSQLMIEFVQDRADTISKVTGNVVFAGAPGQEELFGTALSGGAPVPFELIQSNNDLYLRLPDADPVDQWQKLSSAQLTDLGIKGNGWSALVQALTQTTAKGKRLPKARLENVSTKGYETVVPTDTVVAPFTSTTVKAGSELTVKAQIGIGDKRPYQLAFDGPFESSSLRGAIHATANFASFGQVSGLAVPAADKVKATSPLLFMSDHGLMKADSLIGRDVQRKADVRAIAVALVEYAAAQRPFAYPQTQGVVKLEPGSEIVKLLEPYLATVPTDPLGSSRYYGYRSNGTGFELTASLENTADTAATVEGSLALYRVKSQ